MKKHYFNSIEILKFKCEKDGMRGYIYTEICYCRKACKTSSAVYINYSLKMYFFDLIIIFLHLYSDLFKIILVHIFLLIYSQKSYILNKLHIKNIYNKIHIISKDRTKFVNVSKVNTVFRYYTLSVSIILYFSIAWIF